MESFFEMAVRGPLWVGLFVGLTGLFAMTVLRHRWYRTPILISIGVSLIAASLLLSIRAPRMIVPTVGAYALGLSLATLFYLVLFRLSQSRWPVHSKRSPHRRSL